MNRSRWFSSRWVALEGRNVTMLGSGSGRLRRKNILHLP